MAFTGHVARKEIDFGPDCRDNLAEALKNSIEKRATRKPARDDWNKGK